MDYVIAIPTYKRSDTCIDKTLRTLHRHKIDAKKINLFIVEEDRNEYEKIDKNLYNQLVIGKKGVSQQREFITQFYPENTCIVSLDDDIEEIDCGEDLDTFFKYAFYQCREKNAYIWGVYPVWNPFYRATKEDTTCLNLIVGVCYGVINRPLLKSIKHEYVSDSKEDVERSIKYFINDGIVLRFNKVGVKTKYYGKVGGIGTFEERLEPSKKDCELLLKHFPEYGKIKTRKNNMTEFALNKLPSFKKHSPIYLEKLQEDDVKYIYEELEKIRVPLLSSKMGRARTFGTHRSVTMGYTKARTTRKVELSNYSKKYPELYQMLLELGKKINFEFNSIHINHNVVCPPHKDKNNIGLSCILSIGDYIGGELFINDKIYNTYLSPLVFDGANNTHYNNPIEGNKYSLVFFTIPTH